METEKKEETKKVQSLTSEVKALKAKVEETEKAKSGDIKEWEEKLKEISGEKNKVSIGILFKRLENKSKNWSKN